MTRVRVIEGDPVLGRDSVALEQRTDFAFVGIEGASPRRFDGDRSRLEGGEVPALDGLDVDEFIDLIEAMTHSIAQGRERMGTHLGFIVEQARHCEKWPVGDRLGNVERAARLEDTRGLGQSLRLNRHRHVVQAVAEHHQIRIGVGQRNPLRRRLDIAFVGDRRCAVSKFEHARTGLYANHMGARPRHMADQHSLAAADIDDHATGERHHRRDNVWGVAALWHPQWGCSASSRVCVGSSVSASSPASPMKAGRGWVTT